ncbi:MAG: hypothetical protein A2046_02520 [Bacteroidetes bacterium GWA2_30_7]|nr:MAG: hypothetical protein A2046_02520 [Bacteroidetes bacterium GWA2_30_7]
MIAIESKNKKQNFVCGLYETKKKAENAFQKIIKKEDFQITEHNNIQFPFFLIEKKNKFEYYQKKEEIQSYLEKIKVKKNVNEDYTYCTLYIIEKEFGTKNPENDSMGSIDHVHIDNELLKNIEGLVLDI